MKIGISRLAVARLLVIAFPIALSAASPTTGTVQGHVQFLFSKGTELTGETSPTKEKPPYAEYPIVVRSKDGRTEIAEVPVDDQGDFRITLPAGDYVLDLKNPKRRLRFTARPFTVVAGQTVRVDLEISSAVEPM